MIRQERVPVQSPQDRLQRNPFHPQILFRIPGLELDRVQLLVPISLIILKQRIEPFLGQVRCSIVLTVNPVIRDHHRNYIRGGLARFQRHFGKTQGANRFITLQRRTGFLGRCEVGDDRLRPVQCSAFSDKVFDDGEETGGRTAVRPGAKHAVSHLVDAVPTFVEGKRRLYLNAMLQGKYPVQQRCDMTMISQIVGRPTVQRDRRRRG
ncbi:hypothetical protein D3C76_1136230 [compost metagenome]